MATHYETLGVTQSASGAEIRKAYLRRARALHPDRQLDRNPVDSRKAERAMQQVNVAWNVLSDATKRSAYDARLRPGPVRAAASAATVRTTSQTVSQPRSGSLGQSGQNSKLRVQERDIDLEPGNGTVSVWASIPVLLVIGLLLGILLVTAFAGGGGSDNRPVVPRLQNTLQVNDCFALVGTQPRERSCEAGQADGLIVHIGPTPGNCPSGTMPIADPTSQLYLCWARLIPGTIVTVSPS